MAFEPTEGAPEGSNAMEHQHWSPRCQRPEVLVKPVPVDPQGIAGPTKKQARGPHWRQTSSGLYVPSKVDESVVEQRIFEQGHRIKSHGAVGGWAALRWYGAAYFDGSDRRGGRLPVPLVLAGRMLQDDPRIEIDQAHLAQTERVELGGIRVLTVQRALFDVMRKARGVREAVVAMDMTAAARLTSVALMSEYILMRFSWLGVPLVREALALSSDDSRSPMETLMRLVWVLDAGLRAPICNQPLFSVAGTLLGYPDLMDEESGTVGEYDGADHKAGERHRLDVEREQRYRDHGLEYFTVVGGDIRDRAKVVRRMHATRARARFDPPDVRPWTLTPPDWWVPPQEPLDTYLLRIGVAPLLIRN